MDLSSILNQYLEGEKTGQLLIKFEGEQNLCKIYIENGNAVHIAIGSRSPDETIRYIESRQPVEAHFIKGVLPRKKAGVPFNNRLRKLADRNFTGHDGLDFNAKDSFDSRTVHNRKRGENREAASSLNVSIDFNAKDSFEKKTGSQKGSDDFPDIKVNENITEG